MHYSVFVHNLVVSVESCVAAIGAVRFSVAWLRSCHFFIWRKQMNEQKNLTGYPSIDKPWLKYYSEEAKTAPLPECSIFEYLWENNKDFPKDVAINYLGRKITYGELFKRIDQTAAAFAALGVRPKEIVTLALPSIPEAIYCVYALNRIGAVANMIHPLAGKQEVINYMNEVESRVAVLFDGTYRLLEGDLSATGLKHAVIVSAGESLPFGLKQLYGLKNKPPKLADAVPLTWRSFIKGGGGTPVPSVKKDVDETAIISHTGGTTGEPKGVMCSNRSINALIYQIIRNFEYRRQETCLVVLPPFVNYSLVESIMAMLYIGFTVVLLPKYEPTMLCEYITKYKPYVIFSIPAYWEVLLTIENADSSDMSCLRYSIYGGESMSDETEIAINDMLRRFGARGKLLKGIGCTELMAAATSTYEGCNSIGSVGVPLVWMNCKIVEPDTTRELTYGQEGEICFSGPTLMLGYYRNEEATDAVIRIHADGERWLHTGDLGYIDEDGVLFVTGRIKRIIMTKGRDGQITKLFPDRIEKAIAAHPAVRCCCVIGVPDEQRINYPKAFIELNDGYAASDALSEEIRRFCGDRLPEYQIPEEIEFTPALPRTERGKIDYRALEKKEQ